MTTRNRRIGVCSWSLQARNAAQLVERVRAAGCSAVQLHLDPLRGESGESETVAALKDGGISVLSGMMTTEGEDYTTLETIRVTGGIRPDATWEKNLAAAHENAAIADRLGLDLVTLHAGFIPHGGGDPERAKMIDRLDQIIEVFGKRGAKVAFETGQETAETLLGVLAELPEAGVNFDPANMILYGMGDPHEALEKLGPRIMQLHVKDATPTETPGTWGVEVVAGTGAVDWSRFFEIADRVCPSADLLIEREAGDDRIGDVHTAVEMLGSFAGANA